MYNLKIFSLIWPFPLLIKLFQFSLIFPLHVSHIVVHSTFLILAYLRKFMYAEHT